MRFMLFACYLEFKSSKQPAQHSTAQPSPAQPRPVIRKLIRFGKDSEPSLRKIRLLTVALEPTRRLSGTIWPPIGSRNLPLQAATLCPNGSWSIDHW